MGTRYFALLYADSEAQPCPQGLRRRFEFIDDELPPPIKDARDLLKRFGERYLWVDGLVSRSNQDDCTIHPLSNHDYFQNATFTLVPAGSLGFAPKFKSGSFQLLWLCKDLPTAMISAPVQSVILQLGFLGRGSHGWVDKVKVLPQGQFYARKSLSLPSSGERTSFGSQVLSEIELFKSMDHPHISNFVGAYSLGSSLSIIMEPVAEADLKHVLETPQEWGEVLEKISRWFGCLASALSYLHEQKRVIHRDIKPANILVWSGNVVLPILVSP